MNWIESEYHYCPRCAEPNSELGVVPTKCHACGFASFFGPVAAVGGLITNDQGQLLLVRRARNPGKGKWGLPGGFVDRGESVEDALHREVTEETGLSIQGTRYLMSSPNEYNYQGVTAPVVDLFFECQVSGSEQVTIDRKELEHFEWAKPTSAFLENMAFASNRNAVEFWLRTTNFRLKQ